ncbi:CoA transferase [Reyranella sp.]|uniref:CaiB/BaiF CoA-transferase family protein n=1 Tax=Reyranella sp. TaxID=1929291 RepID=UPI0025EB107E|nr:CoA transferase [Reyranella sp.]
MTEAPSLPLARFKIVEVNDAKVPLCLRLATSLAAKIAADLGADVLKIEPPGGDPMRRAPPLLPQGESALFQFLNTSKRSLVLDLSSEAGRAALAAVIDGADAVLFEEPASVASVLRAGKAAPIEIAAFPIEMDATQRPVSELAIQALGGLMHMVGEPARKPLKLGGHQASYPAGLTAFTSLMAALAARDVGRRAPSVRVSLAEVMQWVNWKAASGAAASGVSPGREGKNSEFQVLPCRDGHVAVVYTVTQWPATRALVGDPRLDDPKFSPRAGRRKNIAELYAALAPWFADKTRDEIQKTAQARGVPFGPIFSPAELLQTEQYVARGFLADMMHRTEGKLRLPQLPVQWNGRSFAPRPAPALPPPHSNGEVPSSHEGGGVMRDLSKPMTPPSRMTATPPHLNGEENGRPLAGIRVLDFGLLTAGANTSAMLADLGADVIKIESGAYLDPFRVVGKIDNDDGWWNRSPQFRFTNRNKRGLALNLKDPEGQRVIRELAAHCDVVVENFRRGVLDRAGLGYKDLSAINPRLVFAAISSQGDTGPERMNVSFGSTLDATSGIASLTGYEGEEPRISGMDVNYPDQIVSLFATGIVIAAVIEARRSGKGAFLDFSQREVASFTLGEEILAASADPNHRLAPRGNTEAGVAQQDSYRCADGKWLAVTLDTPDPSMATFCAGQDRETALKSLLAKGIAAAPCLDGNDLLRDTALQGVTLLRDEKGGLVKGLPYRLDGKGLAIERPAPDLGQHTDEVLRELLGYDDARLKQLNDSGVTSTTPTIGEV